MYERAFARWRAGRGERARGDVGLIELYSIYAAESGRRPQDLSAEERAGLAALALPVAFPGFEVTEASARASEPVEIVEYDPSWPEAFERWRERLAAGLGAAAVRIEHVGSTSVPGLPAKPVIDIQVSVRNLEDEAAYVPAIEAAGVQLRSRDRQHRFFRPSPGEARDVHVHVCQVGSEWERDHLAFRDHLRRSAAAREAYAEVKRAAARDWREDRFAYTDAKTEVIVRLTREAVAEGG